MKSGRFALWGALLFAELTAMGALHALPEGSILSCISLAWALVVALTAFRLFSEAHSLWSEHEQAAAQQRSLEQEHQEELKRVQSESADSNRKLLEQMRGIIEQISRDSQDANLAMGQTLDARVSAFHKEYTVFLDSVRQEMADKLSELTALEKEQQERRQDLIVELHTKHEALIELLRDESSSGVKQMQNTIADLEKILEENTESAHQRLIHSVKENTEELRREYQDALAKASLSISERNDALLSRQSQSFTELTEASLVKHQEQFCRDMEDLEKKLSEICVSLDGILSRRLCEMGESFAQSGKDQTERFQSAVTDYTQTFVMANSAALASVQTETMNSIRSAHESVESLARKAEESQRFADEKLKQLQQTAQTIENQISSIRDIFEDLEDSFQMFTRDVAKKVGDSLEDGTEKLSDKVAETIGHMEELQKQVEANTKEYQSTLSSVRRSMEEMNKLSSEDLKLLRQLVP